MDTHHNYHIAARALEMLAAGLPEPSATAVHALALCLGAVVERELRARVASALAELDGQRDGEGEPGE